MAFRYRLLLLGVVILLIIASFQAFELFPFPKDDVFKEKTSEFSGVLRLWISEENSPSGQGLSAWLTKESAQFEKKHDGVYVQITPVSKETLASFSYAAELPPDMIVFSPGTLSDAQGLIKIKAPSALREEFLNYADGLCTPIAMGASFWAVRKGDSSALSGRTLLFEKSRAQAALYALKSDLSGQKNLSARYGVDLGLPIYEKEEAAEPSKSGEIAPGAGSMITEEAYFSFIKGEGDAVFLSQKELSSLINASAAPEFEIAATGDIYIDQIALFAVTDTRTGEAREACVKFLNHLLSEDAQKRLESAKAFSVTGEQIYAGKTHFQEIEMILTASKILSAPAFSYDNENAEILLEAVIRGEKRIGDIFSEHDQP